MYLSNSDDFPQFPIGPGAHAHVASLSPEHVEFHDDKGGRRYVCSLGKKIVL